MPAINSNINTMFDAWWSHNAWDTRYRIKGRYGLILRGFYSIGDSSLDGICIRVMDSILPDQLESDLTQPYRSLSDIAYQLHRSLKADLEKIEQIRKSYRPLVANP